MGPIHLVQAANRALTTGRQRCAQRTWYEKPTKWGNVKGNPGNGLAPLRVCVVAHPDEEDVSLAICAALQRSGATVRYGQWDREDAAIVVVLSAALLASDLSLPEPVKIPDARLVPVTADPVDAGAVPAALAALNWIPWHPENPAQSLNAVVLACTTDLASYRVAQALLARAEGWEIAGRRSSDLIVGSQGLRESAAAVQRIGVAPASILTEFLTASRVETRKQARRNIGRSVLWSALAIGLAAGGTVVADQISYMKDRSKLELVASTDTSAQFPAVNAVKIAGLIVVMAEHGDMPSDPVVDRLTMMLSEPWPHARYSDSPNGKAVNDTVVGDDGSVLWIDGGGELWHTDLTGERVAKLGSLLDAPGYYLAADSAADVVAAADLHTLAILRSGIRTELNIAEEIGGLAIDPQGTQLVVAVPDGVRLLDLTVRQPPQGEVLTGIMTTAFDDGDVLGLRRSDDSLQLVSLPDGAVRRSYSDPTGPLSSVAIGPAGRIVVQGDDGQLWATSTGDDLTPTGIRVPDLLASMVITPGNELLYSPVGWNTHVFDLVTGRPLADTCREATARDLAISPNGRWLICGYVSDFALWNLDEIRPAQSSANPEPQRSDSEGELSARISTEGSLAVTLHGEQRLWDLTGSGARSGTATDVVPPALQLLGKLTAVSVIASSDVLAIGSSSGEVVVVDVHQDGNLRPTTRWASPDGSPISSISLTDGRATISTTTATWRIPACTECSVNLAKLVSTVRARQLACYPEDISKMIPERILSELGVNLCEAR